MCINFLVKLFGGVTKKEYNELKDRYNQLDSKMKSKEEMLRITTEKNKTLENINSFLSKKNNELNEDQKIYISFKENHSHLIFKDEIPHSKYSVEFNSPYDMYVDKNTKIKITGYLNDNIVDEIKIEDLVNNDNYWK